MTSTMPSSSWSNTSGAVSTQLPEPIHRSAETFISIVLTRPVSNLTNLLAANRVGLKPLEFAQRMAGAQIAVVLVVASGLWILYWRQAPPHYEVPPLLRPRNRSTFLLSAACTTGFIVAILAGVSIAIASHRVATFHRRGSGHRHGGLGRGRGGTTGVALINSPTRKVDLAVASGSASVVVH
jgi:hypothetical protein